MGRDKALLPHNDGGSWLEHSLRLLLELEAPITLYSRHPAHLEFTRGLNAQLQRQGGPPITAIQEPAPWEGPLLALHRLMQQHPDQRLLLSPVDMPWLRLQDLQNLCRAAALDPYRIHLSHDGQRLQPLLGLYPSDSRHRHSLAAAIETGERRLQTWLLNQRCRSIRLNPAALRNVNRPEELTG